MPHKVGVIPFDIKNARIAVLFVTSMQRGRWILPKGDLLKNESHKKGCLREAFEEAGVKGKVLKDFPITVAIGKSGHERIETVAVTYYPLLVTEQFESWPEQDKRERHWALFDDVRKVTDRDDFAVLFRQIERIKPWIIKAGERKKQKLTARQKQAQ